MRKTVYHRYNIVDAQNNAKTKTEKIRPTVSLTLFLVDV